MFVKLIAIKFNDVKLVFFLKNEIKLEFWQVDGQLIYFR